MVAYGAIRIAALKPRARMIKAAALVRPKEANDRLARILAEGADPAEILECAAGLPADFIERSREAARAGAKIVL